MSERCCTARRALVPATGSRARGFPPARETGLRLARRADLRDERGAVVVLAAAGLLAMLLVMVFVVDVANWWAHKAQIQLQADAAALAGGGKMTSCFFGSGGDTAVQDEASAYSGANAGAATNPTTGYASSATSTRNRTGSQFSTTNQGSLSIFFNSKTYPNGDAESDSSPTKPGGPCSSYMLDVKASERNLPLFFGSIAGFSVLPSINARARVELQQANLSGSTINLVVPIINLPTTIVFATLWNMNGAATPMNCPLSDAGSDAIGGRALHKWSGTCQFPWPGNNGAVGVRIGIGSATSILPANGCYDSLGGTSFYCFDHQDKTAPLAILRTYTGAGTPAYDQPILDAVTETSCSGDQLFSDIHPNPCSATITGTYRWPCPNGFTEGTTCTHTITAKDSGNVSRSTSATGGSFTISGFSYSPDNLDKPVSMSWSYTLTSSLAHPCGGSGQPKCTGSGTFPPAAVQQAYGADPDLGISGPIKSLHLSPCCSFQTTSVAITVGLENLGEMPGPTLPTGLVALQSTYYNTSSGSSQFSALVDCGAGSAKPTFTATPSCRNQYGINPTGVCPHAATPPDCIPIFAPQGGKSVNDWMKDRFGACPTNHWPDQQIVPTDPRLLQLWLTDLVGLFNAKTVPATTGRTPVLGSTFFYLTGWGYFVKGSYDLHTACPDNDPPPSLLFDTNNGNAGFAALWGHIVKFEDPSDGSSGTPCSPSNILACTARLTR